ncbi:MAG: hypothetical protein JXA60_13410 [Candidatus Coatesbacteria bacterium]|nr:hypothetical protein [Candidatus Coatesbacteria bacterium]
MRKVIVTLLILATALLFTGCLGPDAKTTKDIEDLNAKMKALEEKQASPAKDFTGDIEAINRSIEEISKRIDDLEAKLAEKKIIIKETTKDATKKTDVKTPVRDVQPTKAIYKPKPTKAVYDPKGK